MSKIKQLRWSDVKPDDQEMTVNTKVCDSCEGSGLRTIVKKKKKERKTRQEKEIVFITHRQRGHMR